MPSAWNGPSEGKRWENGRLIMRSLEGRGLNFTLSKMGSNEKFRTGYSELHFLKKITLASVRKTSPTKDKSRSGEDMQEATPVTPVILGGADRGRGGWQEGTRFWTYGKGRAVGFADGADGSLRERQSSRMSQNLTIWRRAESR